MMVTRGPATQPTGKRRPTGRRAVIQSEWTAAAAAAPQTTLVAVPARQLGQVLLDAAVEVHLLLLPRQRQAPTRGLLTSTVDCCCGYLLAHWRRRDPACRQRAAVQRSRYQVASGRQAYHATAEVGDWQRGDMEDAQDGICKWG